MPGTSLSMRFLKSAIALSFLLAGISTARAAPAPATQPAATVRVAAIGGINDLNFWPELVRRFEKTTGIHVETVATGNKDAAPALFRAGGIDLITMQSGDAVLNLVANGFAMEPLPWMQTDLVIIGPKNDPAGIKGMTDAAAAVKKIIHSKSPFIIHPNAGADEVVRSILGGEKIEPATENITVLLDDHQRRVLQVAADKNAYILIARIPFASGKIAAATLEMMVTGDPILRHPYIVAVADPAKIAGAHLPEARRLEAFLRSKETQLWISEFGKGKFDANPFYFPILAP